MRLTQVLCSCLAFVAVWSVAPTSQAPQAVLFEGARLIAGDGSPPIPASAFIVENGKFMSVGRSGQLAAPAGTPRVDLTGKTVMPALVEMHAHLGYWRGLQTSAAYFTREQILDDLQHLAYYGVAAVLSLGADRRELAYQLRNEWRASPPPDAARFLTAGPGVALPKAGPAGVLGSAVYSVTTESEARNAIRELAANKVDRWLKIWHDSRRGLLPQPVYTAIIEEAHRHNLRVAAHVHELKDFKDLLRAGIDGFAHPTWRQTSVEPVDDELIELFKQRPGVFIATSFWTPRNQIYGSRPYWIDEPILRETFSPEEIRRLENPKTPTSAPESWAAGPVPRSVRRLKAAGVRFGLGTDMGGGGPAYFGLSSHVELESLVKAGLTPSEAIVAATRTSAEFLGLEDLGGIAAGKSADFIVLDANPLDNIANTRRIAAVYLRGRAVDRVRLRAKWNGTTTARETSAPRRLRYRPTDDGWAQLPAGMPWGSVTSTSSDAEGNVYVFRRARPPILKLDVKGTFVRGLADGIISAAHGLRVDRGGAIWVADVRGHTVHKLSPEGTPLMTLGRKGVSGDGPDTFNGPTDVLITPTGEIFVTDGQFNSRVVHFSPDGTFVRAWGSRGTGPGQFVVPHAIALDSSGRLLVADRDNGRIQLFDQRGTFLEEWRQFGPPSGLFVANDDTLYVAAIGEKSGLVIGSTKTGQIDQLIPIPADGVNGPHLVSVDSRGTVYVADLLASTVRKFVPEPAEP